MTPDQLVNIRRPTGCAHIVIEIAGMKHVVSDTVVIAKLQRQLAEAWEGIIINGALNAPSE